MTLFRKAWRATVGTLRVEAPLRMAFEIERTLRPQPNKATLRLWNLTRDHQAQIEQAGEAQVVIEAGYAGERGAEVLFRGELFRARGRDRERSVRSERESTDVVTYVEARDGGSAYQHARISQSFAPGVSVETVLRACAAALGVGPGNVAEVAAIAELEVGGSAYDEGTVLSGQVSRELSRILAPLGLRWSVQHGVLQVLRRGEPVPAQAVRLSPASGLVGVPEVGTRGRVKARALLTSDLWPGRRVVLAGERVEGAFSVQAVKYSGDSHAADWHAELELEAA